MRALRHVGRYELVGEIAAGGMASVYLGRTTGAAGFERLVAIKVCHPHLARDAEFVTMFQDEARLAARIHHPNVVATFDVGQEGDAHFMVMEYVQGERLFDVHQAAIRQGAAIPFPILLRILHDALEGLHAAHALVSSTGEPLRVVHRDVSPQNLLVGTDGMTRVLDFGVARAEERATVTREGHVKGKLGYMAPEQLSSQTVDQRADLFALGVVLWELIVNKRLFRGETTNETSQRVLTQPIQPPSALREDCPPSLDAITLRALNRRPEGRFRTAAEFAETLARCGIPMASTRDVAAYVNATCAEALTARQARFAAMLSAREDPSDRREIQARERDASDATRTPEFTREIATVAATPSAKQSNQAQTSSKPARAMRGYALWIAAALVIAVGLLWWSQRGEEFSLDETSEPQASPGSTQTNETPAVATPTQPPVVGTPDETTTPATPTTMDSPARRMDTSRPPATPRIITDRTMQAPTSEPAGEYMPEEI